MDKSGILHDVALDASDDGTDSDWDLVDPRYDAQQTPSTTSDEAPESQNQAREFSDPDTDEEADAHAHGELIPRRKPGGYDSRVEQMLYENPELPILITDAGKSSESGGRYIVYTIKTGVGQGRSWSSIAGLTLFVSRSLLFADGTPNLRRCERH